MYLESTFQLNDVKVGSCEKDDAFEGVPIDGIDKDHSIWMPPFDVDAEDKREWENAYKETMNRIKTADLGGDELREYARANVEDLKILRHHLFCLESGNNWASHEENDGFEV